MSRTDTITLSDRRERFASVGLRLMAFFVDALFFIPLMSLNFYNILVLKSLPLHLGIYISFIVFKIFFEVFFHGTLGKIIFKIRLRNKDLSPLGLKKVLQRNIFPLCYLGLSFFHGLKYSISKELASQDFQDIVDGALESLNYQTVSTFLMVFIVFCFLISYICVFITPNRQSLHDMWAGSFCFKLSHLKK